MRKIAGFVDAGIGKSAAEAMLGKMLAAYSMEGTPLVVAEDGIGIGGLCQLRSDGGSYETSSSMTLYVCGRLSNDRGSVVSCSQIIEDYRRTGKLCLAAYSGPFVACLFDKKRKVILLGNDKSGMLPCYWYQGRKGVAFASEIKALVHYVNLARESDVEAWGSLFSFGCTIGNQTLLKGVCSLSPATLLLCGTEGLVQIEHYWSYDNIVIDTGQARKALVDQGASLIEECILRNLELSKKYVIPLSGGYDSRCLAGIASRQEGIELSSVTALYHKNGFIEADLARKVSELLHMPNRYCPPRGNLFVNYFAELIYLIDGMGDTNEFIWAMPFILELAPEHVCLDTLGIDVMMRGTSISRPYWRLGFESDEVFVEHLAVALLKCRKESFDFFYPEARDFFIDVRASTLNRQVEDFKKGANRTTLIHLLNVTRNAVALSTYNLEGRFADVCCPFLSTDFISYALSIPPELKFEPAFSFYLDILAKLIPALLDIPNTNMNGVRQEISPSNLSGLPGQLGDDLSLNLQSGLCYALHLARNCSAPDIIDRLALERAILNALSLNTGPSAGIMNCLHYLVWYELFIKLTPLADLRFPVVKNG